MSIAYQPAPIPHVAARKKQGPPKVSDEHVGTNGRIALILNDGLSLANPGVD
jgi:hypothetical protein